MPPAAINIDQLITALSNKAVVDALVTALLPNLTKLREECLADTRQQIAAQNKKIELLEKQYSAVKQELDDMVIYMRRDNVIINGLTEQFAEVAGQTDTVVDETSATSEKVFLEFCNSKLGLTIDPKDISVAHRLGKKRIGVARPIIVRFSNRKTRDLIMSEKKKLRQRSGAGNIYINEHLTEVNAKLFSSARALWRNNKLAGTWTRNGRVFVKTLETAGSDVVLIKSIEDLARY